MQHSLLRPASEEAGKDHRARRLPWELARWDVTNGEVAWDAERPR